MSCAPGGWEAQAISSRNRATGEGDDITRNARARAVESFVIAGERPARGGTPTASALHGGEAHPHPSNRAGDLRVTRACGGEFCDCRRAPLPQGGPVERLALARGGRCFPAKRELVGPMSQTVARGTRISPTMVGWARSVTHATEASRLRTWSWEMPSKSLPTHI